MSVLSAYWRLMRFHRPIGSLLLLWPTLWALCLAAGHGLPPLHVLLVFVAGVILMRAAGCVINDVMDRNFDGHVARTKDRPLVNGELGVKSALVLFTVLCLLAFTLVLSLNRLTIFLAIVGGVLASIYPLAKRYIALPQIVLALAFSWGVPMAFAAVSGQVPASAWLLFAGVCCWVFSYDTAYAMTDRQDDLRLGLKSSAIYFARFDRLIIAISQILLLLSLAWFGQIQKLNAIFFLMLLVAGCFFIYQQCLLVGRKPHRCFQVFVNNNWVGAVIFFGIVC